MTVVSAYTENYDIMEDDSNKISFSIPMLLLIVVNKISWMASKSCGFCEWVFILLWNYKIFNSVMSSLQSFSSIYLMTKRAVNCLIASANGRQLMPSSINDDSCQLKCPGLFEIYDKTFTTAYNDAYWIAFQAFVYGKDN